MNTRLVFVCFVVCSTMVTRHYVLWVQQCPRLCTVVSSTVWMTVRGGGRRCVGFGWAKQQVPSPWGENQFKLNLDCWPFQPLNFPFFHQAI